MVCASLSVLNFEIEFNFEHFNIGPEINLKRRLCIAPLLIYKLKVSGVFKIPILNMNTKKNIKGERDSKSKETYPM